MDLPNVVDACPGNLRGVEGYLFLTLINALMSSKCKLGSREPYPEDYGPKLKDNDEFDFIVVGSGSAGSVLAKKLSDSNKDWRVLVLEAGGYPSANVDVPLLLVSLQGSPEDWQYKTEVSDKSCLGLKDGRCNWPRGKVLGGSSALNAMNYIKGLKRDYDHWAKLGNKGWDWDSVKEYFKDFEKGDSDTNTPISRRIQDSSIDLMLQESFKHLGHQYLEEENTDDLIGLVKINRSISNGIRSNSARAFLGNLKDRPNIYLSLNTHVRRIIIDSKTLTATGVEVKINNNIIMLNARKEIITSAGSINSPQLLLLSGIGPKNQLESFGINLIQDLPVGEHLEDHMLFQGVLVALDTDSRDVTNPIDDLYEYFMHQTGKFATLGVSDVLPFINTKKDSKYPNIGYILIHFPANNMHGLSEQMKVMGMSDYAGDIVTALGNQTGLFFLPVLLNPKSNGKIVLKSDKAEDHPKIFTGYLSDQNGEDINLLVEGIRFVEDVINTPAFKKYNAQLVRFNLPECDKSKYKSDDYWKCTVKHLGSTLYHPTGTCKMSPQNDGSSVVDSRLRVHGVKNLRVADASIMPKIISVNTQAGAMMIGYKAAVMIAEDWSAQRDEL